MSITPAEFWPETALGTGVSTLYTSPAGGNGAMLKRAVFTNTNTVAVTFTVYKVPVAGTPLTANMVIDSYSVASGEDYVPQSLINMVLPPGCTIQALASVASVINTTGSGFTF